MSSTIFHILLQELRYWLYIGIGPLPLPCIGVRPRRDQEAGHIVVALLLPIGKASSRVDGHESGHIDLVFADGAVAATEPSVSTDPAEEVPAESHHWILRHLPADVALEVGFDPR